MVGEICGTTASRGWASSFLRQRKHAYKSLIVTGMERSRHTAEYRPVFEHYFDQVRLQLPLKCAHIYEC